MLQIMRCIVPRQRIVHSVLFVAAGFALKKKKSPFEELKTAPDVFTEFSM